MARVSKRHIIIDHALALFLEQGYKGTSIDVVVTRSHVSKPTVYNHFPDKGQLIAAVIDHWLAEHIVPEFIPLTDETSVLSYLERNWWNAANIAMYRLIIGEGWRFAESAALFWERFDQAWRAAVTNSCQRLDPPLDSVEVANLNLRISHELWSRLTQPVKKR